MSRRFEDVFEEAMDRGLSILGNVTREVILYFMNRNYGIGKGSMGSNILKVHEALVDILGDGARFVERSIVSALCELVGLPSITVRGKDFLTAIEYIRRIYEDKFPCSSI
ncbi:MAG: hypothetical protein RMJ00_00985 [Nitrososphaerota archaeon]|nr:hypothetical protein [Candidatus Bathyarchaeota archaeon]MCX8161488.1 hypothetical protein [Candidatus Bathyarchaeota archaeon]MDW8061261.1 hypothetical protein [Nitrososphaerota archaeon]